MKKVITILISIYFSLFLATSLFAAGPKLTQAMKDKLAEDIKVIEGWVTDSIMINAVKAQNAQKLALSEIKSRDKAWIKIQKSKGQKNALMNQMYNHAVGKWVRDKNKASRGRYPEAFLTDNQGANVAVSQFTSDYWQGDEGKWKNSFNGGNGKIFLGDPEFDTSSKAMQLQVSVPVKDGGKTIGVLVVGVKFSKLK